MLRKVLVWVGLLSVCGNGVCAHILVPGSHFRVTQNLIVGQTINSLPCDMSIGLRASNTWTLEGRLVCYAQTVPNDTCVYR